MIVYCTTCKGRAQHLERTLPKNLLDNSFHNDTKFLILNYNSPDHLLHYLEDHHLEDMESGRVVVYSFMGPGPFRMAHAKNMAHRLGMMEGADVLVNLDADNFTGEGFSEYLEDKFREENVFLWARMIQKGEDRLPRGCNGRIAVTSKAFLNLGGYDEKYETWGPDDKDFNSRLQRLGFRGVEIDRKYISDVVLHSEKMRFKEYPHVRTSYGEDEFEVCDDSETTVANYGNFGQGWVFRNFDEEPVELKRIPTRVFGIGMHKTATSSLHAAFQILGLDSAHWKSAHWAKAIWSEMIASGRSQTLERHYALSDLPITILYKQLDKAYPGSKFILTTRNEWKWLRSVRNHWSPDRNQFRLSWNTDPFTHKIHKEVYGQKGFDETIFLNRFRQHNAEVMEYFKGRPNDLLVMDMDEGAGWPELCRFLQKPEPSVPYPRKMRTH